ncbi:LPS export ABC transporter periplasmic protein LptC [Psychromarinibacter halotolerans]|uniref:LPS export ABC transporter periplasmic protein LptC n=1 Tax=Psychromarinibacter halotolerans TaxID=1775175 RepID=A0ABV7GPW0_9RHOB|nr:LPS export ABC transporter periplasmic protein LptC [Psychromarinibacter halotolerans]MAQ86060.1 hypothetical protein [Maritimibacter sp.]MDF0595755.1 LPS export ABC transporter periplasmic protein LptC [Psychromarinibacter halotolerans]
MRAYDNAYSRIVSWLKVLLPLLALAILSTLFLVARTIDPAQDIPFSDIDIDELMNEPRIGGPTFSGMTEGGAAFSLSADRAVPDPQNTGRLSGSDVRAAIDLPEGIRVDVVSDTAEIDNDARTAGMTGDVKIESSNGLTLESGDLTIDFDALRLWTDSAVTLTAPDMTLDAGHAELVSEGDGSGPYVLVFKGGVKLLYDPKQ